MRSRWSAELLPPALGAVVEGVWAGALGALVTGDSGALFMAGAAAGVFSGAVLARNIGGGRQPSRRARGAVVALTLALALILFTAERAWVQPRAAALGALIFAALLVYLGISLGRETIAAEAAFRRAVRAFALLCGLLAIAALAGSAPSWATGALIGVLVAGALSVAAARAQSLDAREEGSRSGTTWRWLSAVAGILLLVVAVAVVLGLVLRVEVLLWALAVAGELLQYLLRLLGFVFGWAGAGLVRALSWALDLFDLHPLPAVEQPEGAAPDLQALPRSPRSGAWGATRIVVTVLAAVVAVTVPLLIVALALRRVTDSAPGEVEEERETVQTLRSAGAGAATRLRRRLGRLVARRSTPATPADLVRHEYEGLERRLTRAGHPRPAGATVRAYLARVARTAAVTQPRGAGPDPRGPGDGEDDGEAPAGEELAGIYERARYSPHPVDVRTAERFRELAHAFVAARAAAGG